ncbi:MAG: histidinol-phosphate aminotransferase family protein, partial [Ruminiclostridium sp.]|nr:histidinol-phosphate aminotransferase family protein [Ruminiclostridium sp.]
NPNNPTGQLIEREELKSICEKCSEKSIVFLCDECFIDLCENSAANSVKQFLNSNVIILKAFTKTYAMAGLRLGYALSGSPELAEKVRRSGQYWSVSAVAQAAGIAALDEREYLRKAVKIISAERRYLSAELTRFGFTVLPSDTNFILFGCGLPLDEMLLGEGILIRSFEGSDAPGDGYFRIAVKLHEENEALISAIEKVTKWQKT